MQLLRTMANPIRRKRYSGMVGVSSFTMLVIVMSLASMDLAVPGRAQTVAFFESFEIMSVTPTQHELNVVSNTSITMVFTDNVNPATLTDSTIRVNGSQSGLHTGVVTYDSGTGTAILVPDQPFRPGETVDVTLTKGIQNGSGEPLPSPFNWSFTIAARYGSADFVLSSVLSLGDNPLGVTPGDWDQDGDLDLAVSNHNSKTVSVVMNNGDGSFVLSQTLNAETWTYPAAAGDFDRDGDLDLAVPCRATSHVLIFLNNGGGTFSYLATLSVGPEPQFIIVRDFNGDGSLDLVVLCNAASIRRVVTFTNDGSGSFSQSATIALNTGRTAG